MPQTRTQKMYPFKTGGVLKFLFVYAKEETADILETGNKLYYQIRFDNNEHNNWISCIV